MSSDWSSDVCSSELLRKMFDQFGLDVVRAYMNHVQDNAEESVRRVISRLKDGKFVYPMDDGFEIHVGVTVNHADRTAKIDFTGTSGQHPTNYNAPKAVCVAAVLYAFRCLVDSDIPQIERPSCRERECQYV